MEKSENQYLLGSPEKEMSPYIVIRVAALYMIGKSSDFPIIYKLSRQNRTAAENPAKQDSNFRVTKNISEYE